MEDNFPYNPDHKIGTCAKCGKEMVFNVPRLGSSAGFIHKDSGRILCDGETTATVEGDHYIESTVMIPNRWTADKVS